MTVPMFPNANGTSLALPGATLTLFESWLEPADADAMFDALVDGLPWSVHRIRMFGRLVDSPRLSCWMGEPDACYRYSGTDFRPHPWADVLLPVRDRLEETLGARFNSVLANLYRSGQDAMGWHSDDEPELGAAPVIASLSLGGTRRFALKHRSGHADGKLALDLVHGSLLVMAGETQRHYRHALPRTARAVAPRINLTFRHIDAARRR